MTDTITIRLLDRDVVLTYHASTDDWRGSLDSASVWAQVRNYKQRGWCNCHICPPGNYIDAESWTIEEAFTSLDTKLRQLREWLR